MLSVIKLVPLLSGISMRMLFLGGVLITMPATAQSDEDQRKAAASLMRLNFIELVTANCSGQFPEHAAEYQSAFSTWRQSLRPDPEQAMAMLLLQGRGDLLEPDGSLSRHEEASMQGWLRGLGIDLSRPPAVQDCSRIAQNLPTLE